MRIMPTARDAKDAREKHELEGGRHADIVNLLQRRHWHRVSAPARFLY